MDSDSTLLPVDPLPQALILTAIVIGFSVAAYLTVLLYRVYVDTGAATTTGLDDVDFSDAAQGQSGDEGRGDEADEDFNREAVAQ